MTEQQLKEVKEILEKYDVDENEKNKIIDFLNSDKVIVEITYNTHHKLEESVKKLRPALLELQKKGYNIKFEVKGLLIRLEYLYQTEDVQVLEPLESSDLPQYYNVNIEREIEKRVKLGNLILQRLMMKMGNDHPVIKEMGEDEFINEINKQLLKPLAELVTNDKQYERIVKETLKRVFDSKTRYECKAVCTGAVRTTEEKVKNELFKNILISINIELSEKFSKFNEVEQKNILWKIKKMLPFIYMISSSSAPFPQRVEKIVERLKNCETYEEMLSLLNETEKEIMMKLEKIGK